MVETSGFGNLNPQVFSQARLEFDWLAWNHHTRA